MAILAPIVIPEAAHTMNQENSDPFNAAVLAFLSQHNEQPVPASR